MLRERLKKPKLPHSAKLELLVREIVENFAPLAVVVHGSAAKGTFVEKFSDIDVVVVSSKFEGINLKERFTFLLELTQRHRLRVEALGYAPEEFLRMVEELNFFALDVVYHGLPVYDVDGFWNMVCELFNEVKERYKLKKTETDGWSYKP